MNWTSIFIESAFLTTGLLIIALYFENHRLRGFKIAEEFAKIIDSTVAWGEVCGKKVFARGEIFWGSSMWACWVGVTKGELIWTPACLILFGKLITFISGYRLLQAKGQIKNL